jgi:hypothetical protein
MPRAVAVLNKKLHLLGVLSGARDLRGGVAQVQIPEKSSDFKHLQEVTEIVYFRN